MSVQGFLARIERKVRGGGERGGGGGGKGRRLARREGRELGKGRRR